MPLKRKAICLAKEPKRKTIIIIYLLFILKKLKENNLIVLSIAIGGAIGSLLRYYIGTVNFISNSSFPLSTLIVNVTGSFLLVYSFFY